MSNSFNRECGDISYFALYLRKFLFDQGEERAQNEEFINDRADSAAAELERSMLSGLTFDQAQESAMAVLMDGME